MENENNVMHEITNESVENESKQPTTENRCPKCQALIVEGLAFCPECGTPLKKLCQKCGTELQDGQTFCANCGQRISGTIDATASSAINQFNTNVAVQQQKNKRIPIIIGGVCLAIIVIVLLFGKADSGIDFEKEFANIADKSWCEIASDGSYMTIDTNPLDIDDYYGSDAVDAVKEINKKLGFSDSVYQKMMQTRSLDGRVSEENDKFKVSWTYHPDDGMEVMYEKKDK